MNCSKSEALAPFDEDEGITSVSFFEFQQHKATFTVNDMLKIVNHDTQTMQKKNNSVYRVSWMTLCKSIKYQSYGVLDKKLAQSQNLRHLHQVTKYNLNVATPNKKQVLRAS